MANLKAASASASSSAACSASTHYDIFINHRGPDVKKTFAAHLYRGLSSRGLRVFFDQSELEAGDKVIYQINAAIKDASVQIAIFSPRYAESRWCLDELVLMVESEKSGSTILPVFYDVDPSLLRWTGKDKDGAYAVALRKHEERYSSQKIQSWRDALLHVADISGFVLGACNGDEAELLEKVVQRVLKQVPEPLYVAKYPTGLRDKIEDFEKTVRLSQEERRVKVVGIVGLGGVGKTTLANEFFNFQRSNYDGSSFLPDVREKAARSGLHSLQRKLIKDLKGESMEIDRCEQGIRILEKYLRSYRALIIIDNVDDVDQLDAFLPIKDVLDFRSLILATSRDKHVLISAGIRKSSIYHLKGLNTPHSQELFCSHAFFQRHPRPGFENLVERFVNACGGLPLSLKVFGALLCEKDVSYWEEKLNELQTLPPKILASLKISYNSLGQKEQQIFLDIACFAIEEDRDKWLRIWGGLAGFQTLEDRCLVEVDGKNTMIMHDHLRDMGRDIALEVSMPRRLWRSIADVHDLFEEQSSSSVIPEVRGIRMPSRRTFGFTKEEELLRSNSELNKISSHEAFRMKKLRLLEAEGFLVEGILSRVRSPNLIWLRWNDCPCSKLPSWIPMDQLKVLEVNGPELQKLWQCDSLAPLQLRELYVNAPLLEFPKSLEQLKYLEKIHVIASQYSHELTTLPEEFCHVRSLKYLRLRCSKLGILPNDFGNLTSLQHIDLSNCSSLEKLPGSFGNLINLQHIDLSHCSSLEKLPNSLGNLTNLLHFYLVGCDSLEMLPNSLGNLINLQHIYLSGCGSLKKLPNSLGNLTNHQHMYLSGCRSLEKLPNSLGNLTNLQHMDLSCCENLKMLPNSVGNWINLQHIELSKCSSLEMIPDSFGYLRNLQSLDLSWCKSLKILPDSFGNLRNLRFISLSGASNLQMLPNSIRNLLHLKHLHLRDCYSLTISSETLGNITTVECLDLAGCLQMELLPPQVGRQQYLKRLNLLGTNLKELTTPTTLCLSNLEVLILGSPSLKVLPSSIGYLTSLQELRLHGCQKLKCLPDSVGLLTHLTLLDIWKCGIQYLPPAVMKLKNLTTLRVWSCPLRALPFKTAGGEIERVLTDFTPRRRRRRMRGALRKLGFFIDKGMFRVKRLELYRRRRTRRALRELDSSKKGMFQLKNLELYCTEISEVSFPEGVCPNLEYLMIKRCDHLEEVGALPGTLKSLLFKRCVSLRKIKGRFDLPNLKSSEIRDCNLESLDVTDSNLMSSEIKDSFPLDVEDPQLVETLKRLQRPPYYSYFPETFEMEEEHIRYLQEGFLLSDASNFYSWNSPEFCSQSLDSERNPFSSYQVLQGMSTYV